MEAVSSPPRQAIRIRYRFAFDARNRREFSIRLDGDTLQPLEPPPSDPPDWTLLDHARCAHCPLPPASGARCPLALRIARLVASFADYDGFAVVSVLVQTPERSYARRGPLHEGLASLLGLVMVTSGCPMMAPLRPMVRYHLPFATTHETLSRITALYLLEQYFRMKRGEEPDWDLSSLARSYHDIHLVNTSVARRLRGVEKNDASRNAAVHLDVFASLMTAAIEEGNVDETVRDLMHSPVDAD